jgi:protein-S-isoprenylcysteine O-methyltransferase Ste14
MSTSDHAKVVTKPPFIFLASVAVGLGIHRLWPASFGLPERALWLLGAVVVLLAILLAATSLIQFRRGDQNPDPQTPTPSLYTDGVYAWSRNPIYISVALLQSGIALLVDIPGILILVTPALFLIHYGVVIPEEAYLEKRFGKDFQEYRLSVRRWL